jgi:hypothetical protein
LRDVRNAEAGAAERRLWGDVGALQLDAATHAVDQADNGFQQRGLADTVAAHEAGRLPPKGEGQMFEEDAAVRTGVAKTVEGDERGHGAPGLS